MKHIIFLWRTNYRYQIKFNLGDQNLELLQKTLTNNKFDCKLYSLPAAGRRPKKTHTKEKLLYGRFSFVHLFPGRHSFVVLPRATNISPILG